MKGLNKKTTTISKAWAEASKEMEKEGATVSGVIGKLDGALKKASGEGKNAGKSFEDSMLQIEIGADDAKEACGEIVTEIDGINKAEKNLNTKIIEEKNQGF
jgi:hypothetical protein